MLLELILYVSCRYLLLFSGKEVTLKNLIQLLFYTPFALCLIPFQCKCCERYKVLPRRTACLTSAVCPHG